MPYAPLGIGAFNQVNKVKKLVPSFKDDIDACKNVTRDKDIMVVEMPAMLKATTISIFHRGSIYDIALCHKLPMITSRYWNGGHLDQWI